MGFKTSISKCTVSLGDTLCESTYTLLRMHIVETNYKRPPCSDERRQSAQAEVWYLATCCACEWHVEISSLCRSYVVIKTQLLRGT
jgi:hypothetical protein